MQTRQFRIQLVLASQAPVAGLNWSTLLSCKKSLLHSTPGLKKKKSDQLSRQAEAGLMIKRSNNDSISGLWELLLCNPNVKGIPLLFPLKRASPSGQTPKACIFHSNASFRSLRAQWSKCQEKNGGFQLTCLKCLAGALTAAAAAWQLSCLVGESSSSLGRRSCGQPQAPHTGA